VLVLSVCGLAIVNVPESVGEPLIMSLKLVNAFFLTL
jgi:hypothetical protein